MRSASIISLNSFNPCSDRLSFSKWTRKLFNRKVNFSRSGHDNKELTEMFKSMYKSCHRWLLAVLIGYAVDSLLSSPTPVFESALWRRGRQQSRIAPLLSHSTHSFFFIFTTVSTHHSYPLQTWWSRQLDLGLFIVLYYTYLFLSLFVYIHASSLHHISYNLVVLVPYL